MRLNIKGSNLELTDAIKESIRHKLDSVLKHIRHPEADRTVVQVEVEKTTGQMKGDIFRAEINLSTDGLNYRAESTSVDLYLSIDAAKEELVREIDKGKGRKETLFRRGARVIKEMLRFGDNE